MNLNNPWKIGTISYIDQKKVKLQANQSDISDRLFNGNARHINSLNQYLYAFLNIYTKVILRVVSIEQSEKEYSVGESGKFFDKYVITAFPVGEIIENDFKPGVIDIPMVGSYVYACDDDDLKQIFFNNENKEKNVSIGNLSGYDNVRPNISLDNLFYGHTAILGNTGSGKSTTARLLINSIKNKINLLEEKTRFIIFDLHGDYKDIFKGKNEDVNYLKEDNYYLPVSDLSIEDWSSILSPSEKVQKPLLERALKYSKLNMDGIKKLYASFAYNAIDNTNVDSHSSRKFQILKYYEEIQDDLEFGEEINICIQNKPKKIKNKENLIENFKLNFGNIEDEVVERLKSMIKEYITDDFMNGKRPDIEKITSCKEYMENNENINIKNIEDALNFVFSEEEVLGNKQARSYSEGLVTQIHNLRDKYSTNLFCSYDKSSIMEELNKKISIIDVSHVMDDDGLKIFSNFITRKLFQKNKIEDEISPIYLIFDEAHRYISEENMYQDSIFNRIAREGRKFGIHLCTISQIPSELSKVVLSQTSTFFVHRIQNYTDLEYIRRNVPSISNDQVNRLPYFSPGMAVVLGSAIEVPMELLIDGDYKNITPNISMFKF